MGMGKMLAQAKPASYLLSIHLTNILKRRVVSCYLYPQIKDKQGLEERMAISINSAFSIESLVTETLFLIATHGSGETVQG